jgi:hypothetical protein
MEVVTFLSDRKNKGFDECLMPSCNFFNLKLKVLETPNWLTHRNKDILLLNYLESECNDELIFVTDAYDTFFLADGKEIVKKYEKFNNDIVFSAEMSCWPDSSLADEYPQTNSPFKYLNSGGFIGKAKSIHNCLSNYYEETANMQDSDSRAYLWSNQIIWTRIFLKTGKIALDTNCEIFYTTSAPEINRSIPGLPLDHNYYHITELLRLTNETTVEKGRTKVNATNSNPCHIHYNGVSGKQIMHATHWDSVKSWKH